MSGFRSVGVVTVGRSDYSLYRPILRRIEAEPGLDLLLYVSGAHLAPEFGRTVEAIEADGFPIAERVEMLLASDTASGVARSMGLGTLGFAQAFERTRPDVLLVLGDRFEMHAATVAAVPFRIPVGHIHGGELTLGAIDELFRHSMTKLSHLHFASAEVHARRIRQMGEEDWRVTVSGAVALDEIRALEAAGELPGPSALGEKVGLDPSEPTLLVTLHPETQKPEETGALTSMLASVLEDTGMQVILTYPNADPAGREIIARWEDLAAREERVVVVRNLGTRAYFGCMKHARAMVGNSSSGIIEAPSLGLPVVNIGDRQAGRLRAANVIDVPAEQGAVAAALRRATDPAFRSSLHNLENPYGDGHAAERIVSVLKSLEPSERLLRKRFVDRDAGLA